MIRLSKNPEGSLFSCPAMMVTGGICSVWFVRLEVMEIRRFLEDSWKMIGRLLEDYWKIIGKFRKILGRFLGDVLKTLGKILLLNSN